MLFILNQKDHSESLKMLSSRLNDGKQYTVLRHWEGEVCLTTDVPN